MTKKHPQQGRIERLLEHSGRSLQATVSMTDRELLLLPGIGRKLLDTIRELTGVERIQVARPTLPEFVHEPDPVPELSRYVARCYKTRGFAEDVNRD